jgi:glutathione S-transferase
MLGWHGDIGKACERDADRAKWRRTGEDRMPKLYGVARSRATRVIWLAEEAGIALDLVPVVQAYRLPDPLAGDAPMNTRSAAFLALSPEGAVPVLQDDDGTVIAESMAIALHLARRAGAPVGPGTASEDGQMLSAAFYAATALEPDCVAIMYAHMEGRAAGDEGRALIAAALGRLARPFAVLEGRLAGGGWLVGGRFTVADILTAEVVRYATTEPGALDPWPAVKDWLARCHARPGFQAMWAQRMAEPA